MLKTHKVDVNLNIDIFCSSKTGVFKKSSYNFTQVRQYKKDFDFSRKTLYKEQQDYAV